VVILGHWVDSDLSNRTFRFGINFSFLTFLDFNFDGLFYLNLLGLRLLVVPEGVSFLNNLGHGIKAVFKIILDSSEYF